MSVTEATARRWTGFAGSLLRHARRVCAAVAMAGGACGLALAGDSSSHSIAGEPLPGALGETDGRDAAPLEFFMAVEADAESAAGSADRLTIDSHPSAPSAGENLSPPREFFMQEEEAWTPAPLHARASASGRPIGSAYPAGDVMPAPAGGFDQSANWAAVPLSVAPQGSTGFRASLDAACCAWQERWVNWRCSSDYLEGCIPEGYTALPTIGMTSPSVAYSGPLSAGGPVEPGGSIAPLIGGTDLQRKPISQLTTQIAVSMTANTPDATLPKLSEVAAQRVHLPGTRRPWNGMSYYWDASHLVHQPLYFEDPNLERNGYSRGCAQPFFSAARFFGRIPLLPYALAVHPHYQAEYALGDVRPGSPAPYVYERPPLRAGGALFEAAVVTGLFFAIP
jgi:hypothetical protein